MLLTLSTLTFSPDALADAAMEAPECDMVFVSDSVPAAGQEGVPVDIQPAVIFSGDCDGPSQWTLELSAGDDVIESQVIDFDFGVPTALARMSIDELAPDSDYELRVIPGDEGWAEGAAIAFSTGSGRVQGIQAPTILDIDAHTFGGEDAWVEAHLEIEPGADPDDVSIVYIERDGGSLAVGTGDAERLFWFGEWNGVDDLCLSITQENGLGEATVSEPVCTVPELITFDENDRGCGGGQGPLAGLVLLGGLFLRRRGAK